MTFADPNFAHRTYFNASEILFWEFRRFQDKSPLNLAGATQIVLELRSPEGVNITPLLASPSTPGANWALGRVGILVDPVVTAFLGTWSASITVYLAGEVIPRVGTIEVFDRPGVYVL